MVRAPARPSVGRALSRARNATGIA